MNSRAADDAHWRETMAAASVLPKLVGQRVKRREDPRLIQGRGTYVDDVKIPGMQHLAFKRSDIAHGRVRSIDTSAAGAMDGVEAVFTGAQVAGFLAPMPIGTPYPSPEHRALAVDTVRFVGDPVAVVVACDRYVARDAVDAIVVDYESLPAVVDPETAMTGKPAVLHADFPNNVALGPLPSGTGVGRQGDIDDTAVDAAFQAANVVIAQRMVNQRLAPCSIEARGVVAHYEPGREALTIWSSTQNPHILRTFVAQTLGLGEDCVRAIAPEVGGGFGAKINIAFPAIRATLTEVFTNKTPTDAYRGAGRPEATYFVERAMDMLARELGMDPAELRRKNFIQPEQFPYRTQMGAVYDSGDYEKALDCALRVAGWEELKRARDAARADGRLVGLGLSMYVESCGLGPSSTLPPGGWEYSQVTVERDGRISATTGASPHGQGNETTFAQMLADQFGVPLDHVTIHHGDTAVVKQGIGTFGSRSQAVGGAAFVPASACLRRDADSSPELFCGRRGTDRHPSSVGCPALELDPRRSLAGSCRRARRTTGGNRRIVGFAHRPAPRFDTLAVASAVRRRRRRPRPSRGHRHGDLVAGTVPQR